MQPIPANFRASGNKECEELLLRHLEEVRKGRVRYVGIVLCEGPVHASMEYGGTNGCEFAANWAYDMLKQALMQRPVSAPAGIEFGADWARYDLQRAPFSYDFSCWLVAREMDRVRAGAPAPLKIGFTDPPKDRVVTPQNKLMFENVMIPLVEMIGAVVDPQAVNAPGQNEFYTPLHVVEASRKGETVPVLKPRAEAVQRAAAVVAGRPPITITLREAEHDPIRNSNIEAWLRFAGDLRDAGERVIFIRDTAKADEPLADFEMSPEAARDLHFRGALYEQAKGNLFVSNGPFGLALFGTCPWLYLNDISEYQGSVNSAEMWTRYIGVEPGGQYPWSRPNQRIVWKNDDYENICAAWKDYAPLLSTT